MPNNKNKVVLTGFGPFKDHPVNASWVAASTLATIGFPSRDDIDLVTCEIPVEYTTVKETVPTLWNEHKPDLMVHVGVSGIANAITLEQQAHNDNYCKKDFIGQCPADYKCVSTVPTDCLMSGIDMDLVCIEINNDTNTPVNAVTSLDPGRYLCDFIYFTSLNIDRSRTAFIHVPPLNDPYSAHELALGLQKAILAMLSQLRDNDH
ncbi:pyroglutamyl-peptidase 1-like [Tubulanus polymorphus]|uniref:pyroglutamyl-peptidase 1-like n=1 Tax=Tubulanus polymorphus TaxID=672921 RepID=UPI003DA46402